MRRFLHRRLATCLIAFVLHAEHLFASPSCTDAMKTTSVVDSLRADFEDLVERRSTSRVDDSTPRWLRSVTAHNQIVLTTMISHPDDEQTNDLAALLILPNYFSEKAGSYRSQDFRQIIADVVHDEIGRMTERQRWTKNLEIHLQNEFSELSAGTADARALAKFAAQFVRDLPQKGRLTVEDVQTTAEEGPAWLFQFLESSTKELESLSIRVNSENRSICSSSQKKSWANSIKSPLINSRSGPKQKSFFKSLRQKYVYFMKVNRLQIVSEIHDFDRKNNVAPYSPKITERITFAGEMAHFMTVLTRRIIGRDEILRRFSEADGHVHEFLGGDFDTDAILSNPVGVKSLTHAQYESILFLKLIGWQYKPFTDAILQNQETKLALFVKELFTMPENQQHLISAFTQTSLEATINGIRNFHPTDEEDAIARNVAEVSRRLPVVLLLPP